jgi:23S rRNA pseudouridine1911/1915/1917 synthase
MTEIIERQEIVPEAHNSERFDQVAAQLFPEYSRSRLQTWIKSGELTVNGKVQRTRDKVYDGDVLDLKAELQSEVRSKAEPIDLDVVYEDEHIMVINKPAGLVVHPGAGNPDGTLLNALLNHYPAIDKVPRAGIVHRLDRDTTGLMVAAKTLEAHTSLVAQLQSREVHREYDAVVFGTMIGGGTVDEPMSRHPRHRTKMAVSQIGGKEAVTHYRVTRRYLNHTHIRCFLETGRTHQIRVHMAHIKYPLIGDPLYAGRPRLPKGASEVLITTLRGFHRQALHARKLELEHPVSGDTMSWEVGMPDDMKALLAVLATEDVR